MIVERLIELRDDRVLFGVELVTELLMLAVQHRAPAHHIDAPPLGGRHQPSARVVRHARLRPLLESGYKRVLR